MTHGPINHKPHTDCFPKPTRLDPPKLEVEDLSPEARYRRDFKKLDTNRSGHLTRDEWRQAGLSREKFNRYDANGDGRISRKEYVAGRGRDAAFIDWALEQGRRFLPPFILT